jgi:ribulose 1,5-bisphosphate carboxylase large subunit-like protein
MARVKPEDIHPAYKTMQVKSDSYEETNDCSVVATAIAAGISYDKARHMYRRAGRLKGRGVNYEMIDSVLSTIGSQRLPFQIRLHLVEHRNGGRALTFNNVVKVLDDSKRYIIVGKDHMVACLDGRIADWSEGTRYRVENIYEIG